MEQETGLSKPVAVIACATMAFLYVAILYAPTLILRLPAPSSLKEFMIRRFICATMSSFISLVFCALLLPLRRREATYLFRVYGIRLDHLWQAVVFPLSLTCLMYAGSLVFKSLLLVDSWKEHMHQGEGISLNCIKDILQNFLAGLSSTASNVLAWRNYVVAPLTEELVFRACMIPLLFCGGFETYVVILLCPILFSLSHLNHWMEIYGRQNYSLLKAFMVVGLQLGYTVIFGSYASFLFIRTGHLVAPLVAHIFCNFMGLPMLFVRRTGMVSLAFIAGTVAFICLLCPVTQPHLYNDGTNDCECWHGYCSSNLNS
ncbi:PREDICTED: CAAX prenyl protease 2 isoform X1 [Populus euphratica]|uniref:intramembrane prenyl-peptidase Rce1 n=2 Tax=Populus euphratica TaxID=75702 RepID=A0AAJ6XIL2_POPEU|nr:PREDICTED: CAAX prenyl protease 2 isoform X1 [Populus euphratica]